MKSIVFWGLALLLITACSKRVETAEPSVETVADSIKEDTVSVAADSVKSGTLSKRADELFDDFVFGFMTNRYVQKSRVKFPLPYDDNGHVRKIKKSEWVYDRMYSARDVYTLIFADVRGLESAKDTSISKVTVEDIDLVSHQIKQYVFVRLHSVWHLVALKSGPISQSFNKDFYEFYELFATDEDYQRKHIKNPFEFSTYDEDSFQRIDGVLDVDQWPDFGPELPSGKITNINYGQSYSNNKLRILSLCSLSGGMNCTLTFKLIGGEWMLVRLDN